MAEAVQSETAEATEARRSPLEEAHRRAGASLREEDGCVVPADFGDARAEYEAVRGGELAANLDASLRRQLDA
jgi:glycine cleavage system aminomethyltransferase T